MDNLPAKQKLIVVVGPTASGKSSLAIKLAKKMTGEIISADSRQVYCGMDIGTGKVKRDKYKVLSSKYYGKEFYSEGVKHHLIDIANPKKQFTASNFKKLGEKSIREIIAKNKLPIIVGGTGFYIDILLDRMAVAPVKPNKKLRAKLEKQSAEQLFRRLSTLDPQRGETIDQHNRRRLIRALEIVLTTGKPVPKIVLSSKYNVLWIGLRPENLEKRIKNRLDGRLKQGMLAEVQRLHNPPAGGGVSWKRLDDFGLEYRWTSRWLKKSKLNIQYSKFSNSDEYQNLLRDIIKYSKRQMTWFKRNKDIHWFTLGEVEGIKNQREAEKLTKSFVL